MIPINMLLLKTNLNAGHCSESGRLALSSWVNLL